MQTLKKVFESYFAIFVWGGFALKLLSILVLLTSFINIRTGLLITKPNEIFGVLFYLMLLSVSLIPFVDFPGVIALTLIIDGSRLPSRITKAILCGILGSVVVILITIVFLGILLFCNFVANPPTVSDYM